MVLLHQNKVDEANVILHQHQGPHKRNILLFILKGDTLKALDEEPRAVKAYSRALNLAKRRDCHAEAQALIGKGFRPGMWDWQQHFRDCIREFLVPLWPFSVTRLGSRLDESIKKCNGMLNGSDGGMHISGDDNGIDTTHPAVVKWFRNTFVSKPAKPAKKTSPKPVHQSETPPQPAPPRRKSTAVTESHVVPRTFKRDYKRPWTSEWKPKRSSRKVVVTRSLHFGQSDREYAKPWLSDAYDQLRPKPSTSPTKSASSPSLLASSNRTRKAHESRQSVLNESVHKSSTRMQHATQQNKSQHAPHGLHRKHSSQHKQSRRDKPKPHKPSTLSSRKLAFMESNSTRSPSFFSKHARTPRSQSRLTSQPQKENKQRANQNQSTKTRTSSTQKDSRVLSTRCEPVQKASLRQGDAKPRCQLGNQHHQCHRQQYHQNDPLQHGVKSKHKNTPQPKCIPSQQPKGHSEWVSSSVSSTTSEASQDQLPKRNRKRTKRKRSRRKRRKGTLRKETPNDRIDKNNVSMSGASKREKKDNAHNSQAKEKNRPMLWCHKLLEDSRKMESQPKFVNITE